MDFDPALVATVRSREALRFEFMDEQGWDASCGYAALASLLSRFRAHPIDEAQLLATSGAKSPEAVVKVSLAELVRLARREGFETKAWRASYASLPELLVHSSPLLVHYDRPQGHFALVLEAGERGLVAVDPARGMELLTREQFLSRWSGVVLEVLDPLRPEVGTEVVKKAVRSALRRGALIEWALASRP